MQAQPGVSQPGAEALVGALPNGHEVDRYRVERVLGRGGMATVYLVRHATLGTLHALKVLDLSSHLVRERLLLEGRVQARLRHPNLVSVSDVLDVHGAPGLLMEYVDGSSLDAWIAGNHPDLQTASQMFCGILSAMEQAHALGYVHRDLKPANVLLARDIGRWAPKVTDFGIAKVLHREDAGNQTQAGFPIGTPAFMAPEQVDRAQAVDERADIFSLGCILYQLVTHQQAFVGANMREVFNAVASGDYIDPAEHVPELPVALQQGIRGALQPALDARIPDCATLRRVLSGQQPWGAESTEPPNFQLPACALASAPVLEDDPTETEIPVPRVPSGLGPVIDPGPVGTADPAAGPWVNGPTLTMEAFEAAEEMNRGRVRRAAMLGALGAAAAVGLVWVVVGWVSGPEGRQPTADSPQLTASNPGEGFIPTRRVESEFDPDPEPVVEAAPPEPLARDGSVSPLSPSPSERQASGLPAHLRSPPRERGVEDEAASPAPATTRRAIPAEPATVSATGDHSELWLVDVSGRRRGVGSIPPGTYDLHATFPSGRTIERPGFLQLSAGETRTLRCSALMENCK